MPRGVHRFNSNCLRHDRALWRVQLHLEAGPLLGAMSLFAHLSPFIGCRVMVTSRASKTRREGSIPSQPAGS
jgi:hypothetical protein